MKKIILSTFVCISLFTQAQVQTPKASPVAKVEQRAGLTDISISYSRPAVNGRKIFGELIPFGVRWRLGANENTEITFSKTVTIGDKKIKAGTYSLFAIPTKDNWTIIVNKQTDRWGAFSYDEAKDVARVLVPITKTDKVIENFSITFAESTEGANLFMAWDQTQVMLPILFKK